jgi:hypothetical protein
VTILTLDNDALHVEVLPERGAMIASILERASGRELLDQPPTGRDRTAELDAVYGGAEACGWDECFPTVVPVPYPEPPWQGAPLADHGELWSRPWSWERDRKAVVTRIDGARLPYRFTRGLRLDGRTLRAEYEVQNLSDAPLLGLWALHPLFRAEPGMPVELPDTVRTVTCTWSSVGRYAVGAELPWRELSRLVPPEEGLALKLFTGRLPEGRASLGPVTLEWDVRELPYLGLWLNQGGWPPGEPGRYHVAFEPCAAAADDLVTAVERGEAVRGEPGRSTRWAVRVVVGS